VRSGLRTVATAAALVLVMVAIYLARTVLVPFLLAGVIAYTLNPTVGWLERRRVRRSYGVLLVMAGLVLVAAGMLAMIVPEMLTQLRQFGDRLPGYVQAVQARIQPLEGYLEERYPEQMAALRARALEAGRSVLPAVAGWAAAGVKSAMGSVAGFVIWLLTVIVVPVFAYYLLVDHKDLALTLEGLVPAEMRPVLERRVQEVDRVLRAWLKGQLTVAAVLAVIYSIGLTLIGVPLGLLIGVVGGLANMVPYMGLVVGLIPAAILSLLDTGSWTSPLMVVGVFTLGQVLEGTVISPRVVGGGLGMPPAIVLLAVMVGGQLFGFTGLLLAVPATAVGLVLLKDMRRSYDEARLPSAAGPAGAASSLPRRPLRRRRPLE